MSDLALYRVDDGIATLTLNDPERRNALGDDMIAAVVAALERFRADEAAKVLIVTGAGKAFCSGGDLKMMERWRDGGDTARPAFDPIAQRDRYRFGIQQIPLTFARIEKPVIAAVNGPAVGAGCDLALMADIRIASDRAKFGEIFSRLGLAPGDGGAYFLPRIVGVEKACELIFTGEIIDAAEAERIRMVSRIVPDADLMTAARALAVKIASGPLQAHRMAKFAIYRGLHQTLEESLQTMALMQSMLHGTKDHEEGVRAFLEKREPRFEGR